jgi:hypothetical protein
MILAAGYVVFDGLETLEASLKSIRSNVDTIIVSYQTISWSGTRASDKLVPTLHDLRSRGLIDHLIEFKEFIPYQLKTPNEVMAAKRFELAKRQTCLELAKSLGATHYMSMDADEFYRPEEFAWAKQEIIDNSLDATALHYINYVTPTLHRGHSRWLIPFIYRISPASKHHTAQRIFKGIDPTRGLVDESYHKTRIFERGNISMHHMEMVRKDLAQKYHASSRYFPNRQEVGGIVRDVHASIETGTLVFKGLHLGDSDNPRAEFKLYPCENEFGIDF